MRKCLYSSRNKISMNSVAGRHFRPRAVEVLLLAALVCVGSPAVTARIAETRRAHGTRARRRSAGNNKPRCPFDELIRSMARSKAYYHRGLAIRLRGHRQSDGRLRPRRRPALHVSPLFIARASLLLKQGQYARAADDFPKPIKLRLDDQVAWKRPWFGVYGAIALSRRHR